MINFIQFQQFSCSSLLMEYPHWLHECNKLLAFLPLFLRVWMKQLNQLRFSLLILYWDFHGLDGPKFLSSKKFNWWQIDLGCSKWLELQVYILQQVLPIFHLMCIQLLYWHLFHKLKRQQPLQYFLLCPQVGVRTFLRHWILSYNP